MENIIAQGYVTDFRSESKMSAKTGKPYQVFSMTIGNTPVGNLFKKPQGLANGAYVELVEVPSGNPAYPTNKEVRYAAPPAGQAAPQAAPTAHPVPAPAAQPPRAPYVKDPEEQHRIMRQWAVSQAIQYVTLASNSGAIKKKVLGDDALLFPLVGNYANLLFNSVQSAENFSQLPQFTGHVNEVQEEPFTDTPDMMVV